MRRRREPVVDQLNFKSWIEAVQLVRDYKDTHNVTPLGSPTNRKLGWWTVYSAKQPMKTGQIGGGSMGYDFSQRPDHVVDLQDTHVRPVFEEAAYLLAKLGFPRMHANVVIVDLKDWPNPITGGGVGGYAADKKHGFTIDRSHINVNTIVHEHAHMYWFNLPKESQQYFKAYYKEAIQPDVDYYGVSGGINKRPLASPQDMWAHSGESFDRKGLGKAIEESWGGFKEDLERLIGHSLESFFKIQLAAANEDESRLIESTVLTRFGESCMAEAKEEIMMESSLRGGSKIVRPGMHVLVEKFEKYIIGIREDVGRYEHPKALTYDRMHNLVTFKKELLHEKQLEKMKKMIKVGNDKPSRFFAPDKKKEEIEELFQPAAKYVARIFTFSGRTQYNSNTTFNVDQLFPYPRFYSTWVSRIGRRFKAGKINNIDGIKQTYIDSMMSQAKGDMSATPANIYPGDLRKKGYGNLDTPEGSKLRDLIHQQGITPSAYGAANIDELWAVSVEHAAMGQSVSKELKKLIYSTIAGTQM